MQGYTSVQCNKIKNELLEAAGLTRGYITNELYTINKNGVETNFYINSSGFVHFVMNGQNIIFKNNGNLCRL